MIFDIISIILIFLSWIFIFFGVLGIYRFKNIYARLLTSSNIDTVAFITIIFALIFKVGINTLSIRLIIILVFMLLTGPVSNHIIARSAYLNGIPSKPDKERL
ncbi:monovalent cation/H(+) antiporter subunit G [Senegalia massiliensis]|uniref:monovalent cation/H(+) antiporter subunit G n=1 Tax=Senegalia massiliensis TaxID=1720316 RepID=UPI00191C1585|nr:monovalent cation/H(+) antiporter subunit G [Senegalia massiliensis]